jgi:hypothetical protein
MLPEFVETVTVVALVGTPDGVQLAAVAQSVPAEPSQTAWAKVVAGRRARAVAKARTRRGWMCMEV